MASMIRWDAFGCQTVCEDGVQCPTHIDAFHKSTCETHGATPRTVADRAAIFREYTEHMWDHHTFYNCEFGPRGSLSWTSTKVISNLQNLVGDERSPKDAYRVQKTQKFLWKQGDNIRRIKITVMEDHENWAKEIVAWEGFTAALLENILLEMEAGKIKRAAWDWKGFSPQTYDLIIFQMQVADMNNIEFVRGDGTVVTPNW